MSTSNNNLELNQTVPGIRMYIEDPQVVIKRKIRHTVWIVGGTLFGLIIVVLVMSFMIKAKTTSAVLSEKNLAMLVQKQNLALNLGQNWETIKPYQTVIQEALPNSNNLLNYQAALEKAATVAGVQISVNFSGGSSSESATKNKKNQGFKTVPHEAVIKGPIQNIIQFIENINNIPYYTNIVSYKINNISGSSTDYSASFTMQVYTEANQTSSTSPSPSSTNLTPGS